MQLEWGIVLKRNIHDDKEFRPVFQKLMAGITEMITQKLWYLSNRRWKFKGKVRHPHIHNIEFELTYYDKKTEERYSISGYCDISPKFVIKNATFQFDIEEEESQKYISFETYIDEKESLKDIEEAINELLKNNRSYRYFCEDYERYMKQNPIQYIKDLLNDHLIDMEEEIIEDEGFLYRYTGEFGEDSLEIIIDDRDEPEYENEDEDEIEILDCINVNVCDRFYFNLWDYYSEEIRSVWPLLRKKVIPINDFLIRTSTMNCINKEHQLQRIKALVCVDNGSFIAEVEIEAMFCEECNRYFISDLEFEKLCSRGRICSRVITLIEYRRIMESGYHAWADRSLLRSYGYTVNVQDNLSELERHRILSFVIENNIMTVDEVINFIEWLIKRNGRKEFHAARIKWNRDIEFLRDYKPVKGIVRVKDIYRKIYIND